MIEEKFYTEKEGRDPSIYLGIDGSRIPIEIFKGIFSDPNTIYTEDVMYGIQFVVTEDAKAVVLATMNPDMYVTKEDIQSTDIWFKIGIGHSLHEGDIPWSSIETSYEDPYTLLLDRYHTGETGLLEYEEKKFNDKGEYMRVYKSFDTGQHPDAPDKRAAVLDQLIKHINFIYYKDGAHMIPPHERKVNIKTNSENFLVLENEAKSQWELMKRINKRYEEIPTENITFSEFMIPGIGIIELVKDDSIKDMLVTRNDI